MKKLWVIGLLSIVPSLGLIVLGEVRWGIGVVAIIAFFVVVGLFAPWENVSITSYTLAIIAWGSQWYYAVLIARRLARVEAGLVPPERQVPSVPPPPGASLGERRLHAVRQSVMSLLQPGEHLRVALDGSTGLQSLASTLLDVAGIGLGTPPSVQDVRHFYLGVTENDLIFVKLDQLGKPEELQRIPLSRVKRVELEEGVLSDEVVLDIGEAEPLRVGVGQAMRQETQKFVGILSGINLPAEKAIISESSAMLSPDQTVAFDGGAQRQMGIRASTYLLHAVVSAIFLLIGYAGGFGVFSNALMQDQWTRDIVGDIPVQLICCLPVLLPTAISIAALAVLGQNRLHIAPRRALTINGIFSIIFGAVTYIPFQFLLMLGAAL